MKPGELPDLEVISWEAVVVSSYDLIQELGKIQVPQWNAQATKQFFAFQDNLLSTESEQS